MGLRYTLQAFPAGKIDEFEKAGKMAAKKLGGTFEKKKQDGGVDVIVAASSNAISVYTSDSGMYLFFREVSLALDAIPWMELRIQEGSHWDYSVARGHESLDAFSTHPLYWDEEDKFIAYIREGRPKILSLIFGVPEERFVNYLRHWYADFDEESGEFRVRLRGKAYPEDRAEYGNYDQFWDFLRAMNIPDPNAVPEGEKKRFTLRLPKKP